MNNLHYDFYNTGYKIHLPVVPDANDPLTRKIVDYLDQKFGLQTNNNTQYKTAYYKVGSGGELAGGKGITLYGKTQSMQEMKELAQEIEQKFGKELADNLKKYNITFEDPLKLSDSVQARFSVYNHGFVTPNTSNNLHSTLQTYCNGNPSGAIPTRICTTIDGTKHSFFQLKGLSEIDKKFWYGDSTMYAIDNFGELFTGKIENGKVPQFIMDGLPKEYLQHYNFTEKDIIKRINKGTRQIVANMLEDVVNNPNSKILQGNPPWFATLDLQVIDEAKQLLAQYEPQTVQKLEQILPQLEKKCPSLGVLKHTTPFSQFKRTSIQTASINPNSTLNPVQKTKPQVNSNNTVKPNSTNPVRTLNSINPNSRIQTNQKPNPNNISNKPKVGLVEKLGTKGKVGLAMAGLALVGASMYALTLKNTSQKTEVKQDDSPTILNQQQATRIYQNKYYNNYCSNKPYQNFPINCMRS